MKILHTVYDDFENPWCGGGGALRTQEISRQLSDRHDITTLVGAFPNCEREIERDGIRIKRLGTNRSYLLSRLSFAAAASREVARGDFDLWVYGFSAYAPLYASKTLRQRSLLEFFHLMGDHATEKFPLLGHIAQHAEKHVLKTHPYMLTISPTVTQQLKEKGITADLNLVYTGVDDVSFQAQGEEQDYILYFGRLDIQTKGLDILFKGFAQLDRKDVRLILAGRGAPERQQELQNLAAELGIEKRIEFFGPATQDQKNDLFGKSLFVCMPSRYEGWGIVAIEAGAAGKAVIGTNIPGLADAIRPNETGLLVPSEDPEALAQAIKQLLDNPTLRKTLGTEGRKWADQFTWDRIAAEQERVYQKVYEAIQKK
ncbi:MAG: glycosyltransferase family 4 protein [Candidatus Latescibacteria bacterium]|jgi:glycosyltransferase involved in cell wall biosynthesis|nr:glycosyltransferase family 4 protein [Candidatus Latescibacterota bacterium]MBT5831231.1 glycosyltransferase family 4 protein [Candidatus Latescibacterota bacterium]